MFTKISLALFTLLLSTASFAESGFFGCVGSSVGLSDCQLNKTEVAGTRPFFEDEYYHAKYFVSYNFACFPGGYDSNIVLEAGSNASSSPILSYSDDSYRPDNNYVRTLTLEGDGPLTLRDTNSQDTAWAVFAPGCGLEVNFTMAPSTFQVSRWLSQADIVADAIYLAIPSVEVISDVRLWYQAMIKNPSGTSGFLQTQINSLRKPGTSKSDRDRADAYEKIIQGHSLDVVIAPLQDERNRMELEKVKALTLKRKLIFAGESNQKILDDALAAADNTLNKTK